MLFVWEFRGPSQDAQNVCALTKGAPPLTDSRIYYPPININGIKRHVFLWSTKGRASPGPFNSGEKTPMRSRHSCLLLKKCFVLFSTVKTMHGRAGIVHTMHFHAIRDVRLIISAKNKQTNIKNSIWDTVNVRQAYFSQERNKSCLGFCPAVLITSFSIQLFHWSNTELFQLRLSD